MAGHQGNPHQDQERAEHAQDHQGDGDGLRVQDEEGAGPHARRASLRAAHPQHCDARGAGEPRVPAPAADAARRGEARRRDPHHDRQGPVRRPEHQPAARDAEPAQGVAREGHRGRVLHHRQQGLRLRQPHGRQDRLAGRELRRPPVARAPDRPGEDADRRLPRGAARRGAHLLEPLRQHDEAGADARDDDPDPAGVAHAGRAAR